MDMDTEEILARIGFAEKIAGAGGVAALSYFRSRLSVENKSKTSFDPVTRADRDAERCMRSLISSQFPQDKIVGEEFGEMGSSDMSWTLDPIDGTRSFISGSPLWGTLVAFSLRGKPIAGVIEMPVLKERFSGSANTAVWWRNGRHFQMKTRKCSKLESAVAATTSPYQFKDTFEKNALDNLNQNVELLRFGGDCYNYGLLAAGLLDIVMEASLKPEDVHALIPVIENSGGVITTWDGNDPSKGGRILATGDREIHVQILEMLSKKMAKVRF